MTEETQAAPQTSTTKPRGLSNNKIRLERDILFGINRRFWELTAYHGLTLPLRPLVWDVLSEFYLFGFEAKKTLNLMEQRGYIRLTNIGSHITLMPLDEAFGHYCHGCVKYPCALSVQGEPIDCFDYEKQEGL